MCVWCLNENSKKKKKKKNFFFFFFFFGDWDFFFKLGKKSPKSHWERGRISAPEDTKKNPCMLSVGEGCEITVTTHVKTA